MYEYNNGGTRISKGYDGVRTDFYYSNGVLQAQRANNNVMFFNYDGNGNILGFTYNGTNYFYKKNLQGDVVSIVDSSNNTLVNYKYTAYGAIENISGSQANTLGKVNPIRYRGYYYDEETGYYYLNSRYYNPSIGRFINADTYLSTGQGHGVLGYNMFAYCLNNPVLSMDPTGEMQIGSREYEDWKRQQEIEMQQRENSRSAAVRSNSASAPVVKDTNNDSYTESVGERVANEIFNTSLDTCIDEAYSQATKETAYEVTSTLNNSAYRTVSNGLKNATKIGITSFLFYGIDCVENYLKYDNSNDLLTANTIDAVGLVASIGLGVLCSIACPWGAIAIGLFGGFIIGCAKDRAKEIFIGE